MQRLQQQLLSLAAVAALVGALPGSAAAFQVDGWYAGGAAAQTVPTPPAPPPGGLITDGWYSGTGVGATPTPQQNPPAPPPPSPPANPPSGSQATPSGSGSVSLTPDEQALLNRTNQARAQAGLTPLTLDPVLTRLAREKAQDFINNNYFDHNSPVYGSPLRMQQAAGIHCSTMGGENIAGARDEATAWFMLITSPGHRANILYPTYTRIGVGVAADGPYGVYLAQEFVGGC